MLSSFCSLKIISLKSQLFDKNTGVIFNESKGNESFDFSEQLRNNNVDFHLYKADGLIGMHAWAIVMLFKKSKKCLQNSFDYILPKFNKYFTKENKNWIFK